MRDYPSSWHRPPVDRIDPRVAYDETEYWELVAARRAEIDADKAKKEHEKKVSRAAARAAAKKTKEAQQARDKLRRDERNLGRRTKYQKKFEHLGIPGTPARDAAERQRKDARAADRARQRSRAKPVNEPGAGEPLA